MAKFKPVGERTEIGEYVTVADSGSVCMADELESAIISVAE
jgi:hypothetical protein